MRKHLALCGVLLLFGLETFVSAAPKPLVKVALPAQSEDWERMPAVPGRPAHLMSDYGTGQAVVQVLVMGDKPGGLATVAAGLADLMEKGLGETRARKTGAGKLDGVACHVVDLRTEGHHVTWEVARLGKRLYVFHVRRSAAAVGDEDVAAEIASIRDSFRFLEPLPAAAPPKKPAPAKPPAAPAPAPAKDYVLDHWRLHLRKPGGFVAKPLDDSESGGHVVLRFDATRNQGSCMIRVYAYAKGTSGYPTLAKLQEYRIDAFEKRYAKREDPRHLKERWAIPLARRTAQLELVGKRRVTETTRWYFAECRNGRLYGVEFYVAGPWEDWQAERDAFLRDFSPQKK